MPNSNLSYSVQDNILPSPMEQKVINKLIELRIKFDREVMFEHCVNPETGCQLRFDFYLPLHKVLIEYDGEAYHKSESVKMRDLVKDRFAHANGIKLFRLSGYRSITLLFETTIKNLKKNGRSEKVKSIDHPKKSKTKPKSKPKRKPKSKIQIFDDCLKQINSRGVKARR